MKRSRFLLLIVAILGIGIISACNSLDTESVKLDPKHAALPDFVTQSPKKVQETYVLAGEYPEVLESVPCYCGCGAESGHESNLDCFVAGMDGSTVTEWDQHGIS